MDICHLPTQPHLFPLRLWTYAYVGVLKVPYKSMGVGVCLFVADMYNIDVRCN
jgi:hypothetical protein